MIDFYKGKRVFITGHTGFKGSWLTKILLCFGAEVCGFSKLPEKEESLYNLFNLKNEIKSIIGDIKNYEELSKAVKDFKPQIIFHLAAQPLVIESYNNPINTYETNVMGTVHLLESIRNIEGIRSVVNVTTDKVYMNKEWEWGYRENDELNGYDPYSNSKSCSELVTSSYINSFFNDDLSISISTARAGNVIGGGDFADDRIIPDCVRASIENKDVYLRNPYSVRPYQHVFEALSAYLYIAKMQWDNKELSGNYNIGPNEQDCITTKELTDIFSTNWGENFKYTVNTEKNILHEANFLKLDTSKIKKRIGWSPKIDINSAVKMTCEWYKKYISNEDIIRISEKQISEYFK